MTDRARDTFVARFGEDQAQAIEAAAEGHMGEPEDPMVVLLGTLADVPTGINPDDNRGSQPFRYVFLIAIGRECVTTYRTDHGITADETEMRKWAQSPDEGNLAGHDGDHPDPGCRDYTSHYDGWIVDG